MIAEAKTRQLTHDPEEDSVDRAARDLAYLLDANSTGEWDAVRESLPTSPEDHPR